MINLSDSKSPKFLALLYTFFLLLTPKSAAFFAAFFRIPRSLPILIEDKSNDKTSISSF